MSLKDYQDRAQKMIEADFERDKMYRALDVMWRSQWTLPEPLSDLKWIHKVVSTDPHDAVRAGTRVLSSVAPRVHIEPLGNKIEDRQRANDVERVLSWHFKNASRRRRANTLRDIVMSALLYDEIVAQVVYLPYQIKALEGFEGDTKRLKRAERNGPFAIVVRNPQDVHVRYSDFMAEAVLLRRILPLHEVMDFWGKKASKLKSVVNSAEEEYKFAT